jgi:AraC-like DNA-binding protein
LKPFVEQVSREQDFSWRIQFYEGHCASFDWHYHLEYELVLLRHAQGQMFAGSYSKAYHHNSLALFGPYLPHTTYVEQVDVQGKPESMVLWFSHHWVSQLIASMPQLQPIKQCLSDSRYGLLFSTELADIVDQRLEGFDQLSEMRKNLVVIEVLVLLAEATQRAKLNSIPARALADDSKSEDKVEKIVRYIEKHFQRPITINELANHLHMSRSTVQRLFEKHFIESFSEHLKNYRVGKACEMLINESLPIAIISERAGFTNLSNFNRQFRHCKKMTPRQFRDRYRHIIK